VQACCGGLLSPAGGSTGLGAGLLSPAVAALDRRVRLFVVLFAVAE